ncbi:ATP-binding response regulator [Mangrovihabitans endophyticus]|uniref:histidine kinase n=1 Tax=Mangrovihabitans endophyticus TaxID=1751298 RepID=A0A8J3C4N3_9ACTN|nr:hybrid sensor histidine kinase/response regulator [Mangrovihabitans endophyticus]GGL06941.1 histidine kinase [Mangrovihabitans endophyticus]
MTATAKGPPEAALLRVLLVEDNPGDAELAREQLTGLPGVRFEVREADRLSEAWDSIAREAVDAVVLDLNLPDSWGIDTLRRLRERHRGLPITVVAGSLPDDFRSLLVSEGASDVIDKDDSRPCVLARSVMYAVSRQEATLQAQSVSALVRADPDAIIVYDDDGVVRFVNDAATRIFGRPAERFVGAEFGFSFASGGTTEIDIMAGSMHRVGEMRTVRVEWMGCQMWLAAIRDVTEQRMVLRQLHEAQKLDALGRLAGGVAHDFNNMLAIVLSAADVLEDMVAGNQQAIKLIGQVQRASTRASAIANQLLAFGRDSSTNPEPLDLNNLVQGCVDMLCRLLGKNIDVVAQLDPNIGTICADATQLEQILMNLVINARDAMPEGGRIRITTAAVVLGPDDPFRSPDLQPGEYTRVSVEDNGTGMPEEIRSKIFEPFFTTKEPGKGTGLGLATTFGIVAQAGGSIAVDSRAGVGTTFTVHLPVVRPSPPVHSQVDGETAPLPRSGSVLVVDDEADLRDVVADMLGAAGYDVGVACSGAEAVALAETRRFEMLLTDINMPKMNGFECADLIREIHPRIAVVFMTANPVEADDRVGANAEAAILPKPFQQRALLGRVRQSWPQPER